MLSLCITITHFFSFCHKGWRWPGWTERCGWRECKWIYYHLLTQWDRIVKLQLIEHHGKDKNKMKISTLCYSFPSLLQASSPPLQHSFWQLPKHTASPSSLLATVMTFLSARTIAFVMRPWQVRMALNRRSENRTGKYVVLSLPREIAIICLVQFKWTIELHEKSFAPCHSQNNIVHLKK